MNRTRQVDANRLGDALDRILDQSKSGQFRDLRQVSEGLSALERRYLSMAALALIERAAARRTLGEPSSHELVVDDINVLAHEFSEQEHLRLVAVLARWCANDVFECAMARLARYYRRQGLGEQADVRAYEYGALAQVRSGRLEAAENLVDRMRQQTAMPESVHVMNATLALFRGDIDCFDSHVDKAFCRVRSLEPLEACRVCGRLNELQNMAMNEGAFRGVLSRIVANLDPMWSIHESFATQADMSGNERADAHLWSFRVDSEPPCWIAEQVSYGLNVRALVWVCPETQSQAMDGMLFRECEVLVSDFESRALGLQRASAHEALAVRGVSWSHHAERGTVLDLTGEDYLTEVIAIFGAESVCRPEIVDELLCADSYSVTARYV